MGKPIVDKPGQEKGIDFSFANVPIVDMVIFDFQPMP